MTRSKPFTFLASATVIPLVALAITAGGGSGAATAVTPKSSSGASVTVSVANSSLLAILVHSAGRTLYLFKADVGMTSACATAPPPLPATGTPTASTGVTEFGAARCALMPVDNQISTQPTSGGGYGY